MPCVKTPSELFAVERSAQAQLKPEIPANGTTDHHHREAMAVIERFRLFHLPILRDHLGNVTKPIRLIGSLLYRSNEPICISTGVFSSPDSSPFSHACIGRNMRVAGAAFRCVRRSRPFRSASLRTLRSMRAEPR